MLERDKGKPWQIVKPVGADADQTQANNLARAIADGVLVRTVDDKPADLAPFGLKPPTTTVTVTTFDNKTLPSIEVGKSTPIGFNAYVRLSNSPAVLLTEGVFSSGMNKTVNDLRVRDLMAFKIDDVQKLIIARDNGQTVEIDRDGDNWKIVKPAPSPADDMAVRTALEHTGQCPRHRLRLRRAAQRQSIRARKTASGGDRGAQERRAAIDAVRLQAERAGQERNLRAPRRARAGLRRGRVRDDQPRQAGAGLPRQTIVKVDPETVETVKVRNSDGEFTLKRAAGGKWDVIAGGKTSEGDIPVVERLLNQFRDLKGESIVADPMPSAQLFGLDNPALEITLAGKDGKELETVKLAKISVKPAAPPIPGEPAQRTEYYATSSGSKAVYSINDFSFAQLNKPAPLYMAKAAEPAAVAREVGHSPGATGQRLRLR